MVTCEAPSYFMPLAEAVTVTEVGGNTAPLTSMPNAENVVGATAPSKSYSLPTAGAVAVTKAGVTGPLMSYAAPITGVAVTEVGAVTKSVTMSEDTVKTRTLKTRGWKTKFRAVL